MRDAPKGDGASDGRRDGGPLDGTPDAPLDARTCPAGYAAIAGGPATSKYLLFPWDNASSRDKSQPWTSAKTTCMNDGTHLAIPDAQGELDALRQAIAVDPSSPYFWVGLTDSATEGTWLTVLGGTPTYLPWGAGQPNNGNGPGGSGQQEDCALGHPSSAEIFDWICATPYPFACECD
jgi:hypothetical protein